MKKIALNIIICILLCDTLFAAKWVLIPGSNSWCCMLDDGSIAKDKWTFSDTDRDGKYEFYYFNSDGIMLSNVITPDGYQVDMNGALIINGIVQTIQFENEKIALEQLNIPVGSASQINTANIINTAEINTSYDKKKELKQNIVSQKNIEFVDAIKIGSKNWVNAIRFSGTDSYIKANSGEFNSLSFEAGIKEINENAEYLLTIFVNNKEAEVIDEFSKEGEEITISIDPNSEVMLVYSCTTDSNKYLSNNQKSLYIRNARFNKTK